MKSVNAFDVASCSDRTSLSPSYQARRHHLYPQPGEPIPCGSDGSQPPKASSFEFQDDHFWYPSVPWMVQLAPHDGSLYPPETT